LGAQNAPALDITAYLSTVGGQVFPILPSFPRRPGFRRALSKPALARHPHSPESQGRRFRDSFCEGPMLVRYRNERRIVISSTTIPPHGDEQAGAIMR